MSSPRIVGILVYDGVQALDVAGPADAFAAALIEHNSKPIAGYKVRLVGFSRRPVISESGIAFHPSLTVQNCPQLDTLVVPGGRTLRLDAKLQTRVSKWVKSEASRVRRIATVCTGVFGIARSGLMDGRRVTTHWRYSSDLRHQFPRLRVDATPLFIKDGRFYSSAGITAGIDLALALIEEDLGPSVALAVARDLVVYLKRTGGQEQFSEPLQIQTQAHDRLADVAAWLTNNLGEKINTELLAAKANVCPRHFSRLFRQSFGDTPAEFVEKLRLGEARRLLAETGTRVEKLSTAVGFSSADAFRRAFLRRFGITPTQYRQTFPFEKGSAT